MVTSPYQVRSYQLSDRQRVRQIAFETADGGRPSSFLDPILQMDLLTRYYTDVEPQSTWIVENDGRVGGYLTGCLDSYAFQRWVTLSGNLISINRLVFHNLFKRDMWHWVRARFQTLREGGAHRPQWVDHYPAHLHMNLVEKFRGHGVGSQLLRRFILQCETAQLRGIHLTTRRDNQGAQTFFSRHGFQPIGSFYAYRASVTGLEPVPVLVMGLKLAAFRI